MSNFRLSVTGGGNKLFAVLLNVVIAVVVAVVATSAGGQQPPNQFTINILSSPAYAVTGAFRALGTFSLRGFITGLRSGPNVLSAGQRSTGQILAKILVFNYPRSGPIFSGPHQTPFVCETDFQGLGPPLDPDCSAPTRVD